jgi:hypothetical protein
MLFHSRHEHRSNGCTSVICSAISKFITTAPNVCNDGYRTAADFLVLLRNKAKFLYAHEVRNTSQEKSRRERSYIKHTIKKQK